MKVVILLLALLMLTGCSQSEVFETVTDELAVSTVAQPRQIRFDLAQDTLLPAMETDEGQLYLCGDFDVMIQTMDSGDLNATVYQICGFYPDDLTFLQTGTGEIDQYEFVWTSATDGGQQIGRATILDDGNYHYSMSATVDSKLMEEYQEIWNGIFESFTLD